MITKQEEITQKISNLICVVSNYISIVIDLYTASTRTVLC